MIDAKLRTTIRGLVSGELPWPLFLTGAPGRGKSAAALLLADHVRGAVYYRFTRFLKACQWAASEAGAMVRYWSPASTSADETKMIIRDEPMREPKFWRFVTRAPLVVIDDLATRGGYTEPQYDHLYDLVEERKLRPLVLVSNLSLVDLGQVFDERIVSRLARGTIFTLEGSDRRIRR